jgi:DNA-binding MarR family transcriptional regulator
METNDHNLIRKLFQLQWLLRRYLMQHRMQRGPMGAPYQGQGRILSLLKLKPEISQKDLAHILDMRSQSLGELLAKLERSGYITRTPSHVDRRGMDIRLTESGRAASEKDERPEGMESFFDCLSEEEQATLSDFLGRLNKSLEDRLSAGGPENFRGRGFGDRFHHDQDHPPVDRRGFERFFGEDRPGGPTEDEE